eukprot:6726303-Pyramimonas_sp.AAC.1
MAHGQRWSTMPALHNTTTTELQDIGVAAHWPDGGDADHSVAVAVQQCPMPSPSSDEGGLAEEGEGRRPPRRRAQRRTGQEDRQDKEDR